MLSFKSFLVEMGQYLQHHTDKDSSVTTNKPPKNIEKYGKLHSVMDSGHEVRLKHNKQFGSKEYSVIDLKTKLSQINLHTLSKNDKHHTINELSGRKDSPVKAHQLYHHLITNHGAQFMTHSQSPGGFKVWQKLHKMPGIDIHVHDESTGKTTKVDNMDNYSDFHHAVTGREDLNHPNTNKYLIASKHK
jgi:hypothetical protein